MRIIKKFIFVCIIFINPVLGQPSFLREQKKYPNVRQAYEEYKQSAEAILSKHKLSLKNTEYYLRVLKHENELELWGRNRSDKQKFTFLKKYTVCAASGKPGPKRKQGDGQVPEGFYFISWFNPSSFFDLSMKVSYPNESDKILGLRGKLGGDIFIHGACVTIGCIPLQNEIFELYLLLIEAKASGQTQIPVHIFPYRLDGIYPFESDYQEHIPFWKNLKEGFLRFEKSKVPPRFSVDEKGLYQFL